MRRTIITVIVGMLLVLTGCNELEKQKAAVETILKKAGHTEFNLENAIGIHDGKITSLTLDGGADRAPCPGSRHADRPSDAEP